MKYRQLGKTRLKVSEVGLGTAQLGGTSIIANKPIGTKPISEKRAISILNTAYTNGINFFDTSNKYGDGRAERLLGNVFKYDEKIIIATKCGIRPDGKRDFSKNYVVECVNKSLKRLKRKHIDILQLTKPSMSVICEGKIFDTLDYLKSENLIRFSGISVGKNEEGLKIIEKGNIDTLQIFYNLLDTSANDVLIPKAHKKKIGIIIKSPLSSGLLSGKYNEKSRFPEYDNRSRFLDEKELEKRFGKIDKILKRYEITKKELISASFKFLLSNKHISTIIPGASSCKQLKQNLKYYNEDI